MTHAPTLKFAKMVGNFILGQITIETQRESHYQYHLVLQRSHSTLAMCRENHGID